MHKHAYVHTTNTQTHTCLYPSLIRPWSKVLQQSVCPQRYEDWRPLWFLPSIFFKLSEVFHEVSRVLIFYLSSYCYMTTLFGVLGKEDMERVELWINSMEQNRIKTLRMTKYEDSQKEGLEHVIVVISSLSDQVYLKDSYLHCL